MLKIPLRKSALSFVCDNHPPFVENAYAMPLPVLSPKYSSTLLQSTPVLSRGDWLRIGSGSAMVKNDSIEWN